MAKRRKGFLEMISAALKEPEPIDVLPVKKAKPVRKKGFLDSIKDDFEDDALDDVLPLRRSAPPRKKRLLDRDGDDLGGLDAIFPSRVIRPKRHAAGGRRKEQSRVSTTVDSDVMKMVRRLAEKKEIRIKDIINEALQDYLKSHRN